MKILGKVKRNSGRGRTLGFPTANLDAQTGGGVDDGIYAGFAEFDDKRLASLVFVGAAETFGESEKQVEAYILDFKGDLYGKELRLEFIKKIRDNQKFETQQELVRQMKEDERVAREFFAKKHP